MLHGHSLVIFCSVYILSLAQSRRALNARSGWIRCQEISVSLLTCCDDGGKNIIFILSDPAKIAKPSIYGMSGPHLGYINFFKLGISGNFSDGSKARANPNLFQGFSKKRGKPCGTSCSYNIWGAKRSVLTTAGPTWRKFWGAFCR